ncbi:ANTAR domain-containing protein [Streptomyces sp. NPDC016845]|uniref:ANTAR domain-containing protein n=1 Tax=Streptomyces sp. NPDC016845 TaxID=3364972 RepID=UPI0037A9ECBE
MEQPERDERLARAVLELTATATDDFHLADLLRVLTEHVVELLGVPASGVVLVDDRGRLVAVTATTGAVRRLGVREAEFDEGPGRDCCAEHTAVGPVDLGTSAAAERWPRFTGAARAAGFGAVAALPMRLRKEAVGAVNVFDTAPDRLGSADLHVAQVLADATTIGIVHRRFRRELADRADRLRTDLDRRIAVEQAKGAVAARLGISPDAALLHLSAHARARRMTLPQLCARIVTERGDVDLPALPGEPYGD